MSALLDELQELRAIRDRQVAEIQKLRAEIRELRRRQGEPEAAGRPLAGLKLTLVGPSFRQRDYLNILEPLGAKVLFYASDGKLGQITHGCAKAHGILFITTYTSHKVDDQLTLLAERTGIPLHKLPFKGLDRLREAALAMAEDMRIYKELYSTRN